MNIPTISDRPDASGEHYPAHAIVRITLAACLTFWIFVFTDSGWGPILTPLSNQLHIPLATTGLFYVIWSTGYLPGALAGGAMLDRYGPRRVFFGAALIILCGTLLILAGVSATNRAPTTSFLPVGILLVIAGLAGIGGGVIDASTNGLISASFAEKRGMALNLFNLLYPLGGVLIALTDALLLKLFHNDPRPCFIFTMCFTVVAMISLPGVPRKFRLGGKAPITRRPSQELSHIEGDDPHQGRRWHLSVSPTLLRSYPTGRVRRKESYPTGQVRRKEKRPLPASSPPPPLRGMGSSPSLLTVLAPVIVVMMLTSGISSSTRVWTPAYLHVAYGQTPAIAAALSSVAWALAASSRLGAGLLILRIGSWRMVMLGIVLTLLGLVAMMFSPNAIVATLAIALTSIGLSPIFATCLAIGSERAGRSFGSVTGILLFVSGISTVFCGWFFGFLLNTIGPIWPVIFCFSFIVLGGLLALRLRPAH